MKTLNASIRYTDFSKQFYITTVGLYHHMKLCRCSAIFVRFWPKRADEAQTIRFRVGKNLDFFRINWISNKFNQIYSIKSICFIFSTFSTNLSEWVSERALTVPPHLKSFNVASC